MTIERERAKVFVLMLDLVRTTLHRVLETPAGDTLPPIRVTKDLARRLNVTLGQPICSADALAARRRAEQRLVDLRRAPASVTETKAGSTSPLAPVKVYFEGDRNARELERIRETLGARGIVFEALDVAGDEAMIAFILREASCERDELPIVFVGPKAVGGFRALVDADLSGALPRPS